VVKEVTEDIRQAADYLSKAVEQPAEAKGVAIDLSQRVGSPERPILAANDVSAALTKGNRSHEDDLADLMTWLDNREGTALEGTGLSLWAQAALSSCCYRRRVRACPRANPARHTARADHCRHIACRAKADRRGHGVGD